jgi:acetylornithine deacetylase
MALTPNILIDKDYINTILPEMVKIDSTNPSCTPEGKGEVQLAEHVGSYLEEIGLDVKLFKLAPKRVNVLGLLPGRGSGQSLMLNAHMDTVGVEGMQDPFSARIADGRMYGRGTQDMKGSLAASIAAIKALVESGIETRGDIYIAAVADEEYLSIGTMDLIKHIKTDAAIVTEPTDMKIGLAHRGFAWLEVETLGKAAHGSRYLEGIDANMHMGRVLNRLEGLQKQLQKRPSHPLVGVPSLHVARIQGGTDWSIYSDRCLLQIERRTIPGETEHSILEEIQSILNELKLEDEKFSAKLELKTIRTPHEISSDKEIIRALQSAYINVLHEEPEFVGASYWTDAAILGASGIDAVLIGPAGSGLHSTQEWVELSSIYNLAEIIAYTALFFCNGGINNER